MNSLGFNSNKRCYYTILITIIITILSATSINSNNWFVTTSEAQFSLNNQQQQQQQSVFVMYAASLIKTFEESIGPTFQKDTGYTYQGEARGSVQIANMIIDGLRKPDVFVSAGTVPIMRLMNNTAPLTDWLVKFGSAEMVIAYSPNSRFYNDFERARIGEIPWYEVLSKQGIKFGRTDPELDPKGYYMIITAKLYNIYYNDSTIKQRILGNNDRNPKQIFPEEILKTILEQGQLDAVAAYKHEAVARGLPYITLPSQINLADPTFANFYRRASYTLENGSGGSSQTTIFGEPIYFSFTIPQTTVKNTDGAISFGTFILSDKGQSILQDQGLNPIKPVIEGSVEKMPSYIRSLIIEEQETIKQ
jgi:molybdate/tungstate transport system substrate-binding protein